MDTEETSGMEAFTEDVAGLWQSYWQTHGIEERNELTEHYLSLVRLVAGRLAISLPPYVDRDDLLSSGFFGLLDAVERYDPERQIKFETYACVRIRGAMLDYLRAKDWMPVATRQRIHKFSDAIGKLTTELGREPTEEELQDAMGMSEKEYRALQGQLSMATVVPLDDYLSTETPEQDTTNPSARLEAEELRKTLAKAIDKLPEKERIVVALYYNDELTLKEIANILHLTEARISQLHTKAVFRLRGSLARMKATLL